MDEINTEHNMKSICQPAVAQWTDSQRRNASSKLERRKYSFITITYRRRERCRHQQQLHWVARCWESASRVSEQLEEFDCSPESIHNGVSVHMCNSSQITWATLNNISLYCSMLFILITWVRMDNEHDIRSINNSCGIDVKGKTNCTFE